MQYQSLGDKSDFISRRVRSDESSATISKGQPVILVLDGTEDGLAVVLPSTAGAAKSAAFPYGVALKDIAPGTLGDVFSAGLSRYNRLIRQTRGASTDAWASEDTLATAIYLTINTVGDGFSTTASSGTFASNTTVSVSHLHVYAILAESLASYASSASATSDSRTAITAAVKAFIRLL